MSMSTDLKENIDRIQESALLLSNMLDNLFSYSGHTRAEEKQKKEASKSSRTEAESHLGKKTRRQVTGVLVVAMLLVLFFCDRMLIELGKTRMSEEARMQEMAAKEKRTGDVTAKHQVLVEHYKELQNRICAVISAM